MLNSIGEALERGRRKLVVQYVQQAIDEGAPVTQEFCESVGADCCTNDAASAAIRAHELLYSKGCLMKKGPGFVLNTGPF